jgi:hypothetical protein
MAEYTLHITQLRPYFAELPYYAWGRVNYDSEGDCKTPLDRNWTWIELTHRDSDEHIVISSDETKWTVSGDDPAAKRIAQFLKDRCGADSITPNPTLDDWDVVAANARAGRVAAEFENELLAPFAVGHLFWGSWKWIGWFGTDFTWVGRWIMDSVVRKDSRAVGLCIDWLREGTFAPEQSMALRYALSHFTGLEYGTDIEWVSWYDSTGKEAYPDPDMSAWYEDMKAIHDEDG